MNILVPWPCLYETFNTRFAKDTPALKKFESFLRKPHVVLIQDDCYREKALNAAFQFCLVRSRPLALVDMVIRLILENNNVRKHAIITFNPNDFRDLCNKYNIEML